MTAKTTKTALLLAFLSGAFHPMLFSQTQITGSVTNTAGQGLPAASVLLLAAADSTLVKGQLSAVDGSFTIDGVAPGAYRLGLSMLGCRDYFSEPFTIDNQTRKKVLGATVLKENAQQLNEVSVVAKRPLFEQQIDRLVVNVGSSITSAGSNALEVLQRSPGVMVNRGANFISMSGKNGVVIMINGKISRLPSSAIIQMLEGMNADNIERIELIQTPPANFDAEGNAGIINIVLKKNSDEGFNGGYGAYAGYGLKEKSGANLNFNYRRRKANLYGDYSWTYDNNPQVFSNYRSFVKDGNLFETDGRSDRDPTRTHTQNGRLGLDLQLSPKTVLGGLLGWMDRYWTMDALNKVAMRTNGVATGFIEIPNDEINHWRNYLGNLNLEHHFTKNQTLNLDLDYVYYHFTNPSNYLNRYLDPAGELLKEDQVRVHKTTPMGIFAGKADFTRKFGDKMTLETGLKATMTRFDNDVLVEDKLQSDWVRNPGYSADYGMEEDIAAAYTAFTTKLNAKTDLKAGLRYEYTHSNLGAPDQPDILDRKYGKLFPSLFLSHKINEFNTLQFSYSRRINRPNFNQLAPYFIFYDPTTVETGNPKLQPSITDAVKADYMWKSFQLSVEYSYEDEAILQGQPEVNTETNQQLTGAVNFDYGKYALASLSMPFHPAKWWDIQLNLNGQWVEFKDKNAGPLSSTHQINFFGFGSQTFRLPKQFSIEVSGWYFSGGPFGKVYTQPMGELSFGIGKELGGNRGNLRLNVGDVLLTSIYTGRLDDTVDNIHYRGTYQQNERIFRLSYSNKFGNTKLKASRQRATGSEEERRRVN